MLQIMLCGASDTEQVRLEFSNVVAEFGGEPWHYLAGHVLHTNATDASWVRNARATVKAADLCVFVVLERPGEITWNDELLEALSAGKPFLIFCARPTYTKYLSLVRSVSDMSAITNDDERALITTLWEIESQRGLTVIPFDYGYFGHELRRQLGTLFQSTLGMLQARNVRSGTAQILTSPGQLTASDLAVITEIALDETEDKNVRKRCIRALAERRAADPDAVDALLRSWEQGVQRLSIELLPDLYLPRPPDEDFLSECITLANGLDEVGVRRRMIGAVVAIDLGKGLEALEQLDLDDVGTRRRLAVVLEENESEIRNAGHRAVALRLADRCIGNPTRSGWETRLRELRRRLEES